MPKNTVPVIFQDPPWYDLRLGLLETTKEGNKARRKPRVSLEFPLSLVGAHLSPSVCRNSSYCAEVSIHLTVMEKTAAREIAYLQVLFTSTSGKIVCPDLWDFTPNRTSLELQWYKVELSPPLCAKPDPNLFVKTHTSPLSLSPEHHVIKVMSMT